MKFDFITDESERSLAPFFSKRMSAVSLNSFVVLGVTLLLAWPRQDPFFYIRNQTPPLVFVVVFGMALLLNSYVNLRAGRGEISEQFRYYWEDDDRILTYEQERAFWGYGFVQFAIHTILLILPMLPILMIAARVSAVTISAAGLSVAIIVLTSLASRLFGFFVFLTFGRSGTVGFFLSRLFWAALLFGTYPIDPFCNPTYVIYELHRHGQIPSGSIPDPYLRYIILAAAVAVVLAVADARLVRHGMRRRSRP